MLNYDWKGGIVRRSIECSEQNRVLWTKFKIIDHRTIQYICTCFLMNWYRLISYRERSIFVQRPQLCSEKYKIYLETDTYKTLFFVFTRVQSEKHEIPPLVLGICARSMFYTNWYKIEMINNWGEVQEFIIIRKNQYKNKSHGIILVVDTKIKSNVNVLFYYLVQMLRILTFWFVQGTKTLNIKCNVRNLLVRCYNTPLGYSSS